MELDELKNTWAIYDKKLTESLKMNEELLRKLNLNNSKSEMNNILYFEILSIIIGVYGLYFFLSATIKFSGEFKFFISGVLTCLIIIVVLFMSIKKVKVLSNIDYFNSSIIELQKSILNFKHLFLKYKKVELFAAFFFALVISPILVKALRNNIDVYADPLRYIIGGTIGLGIGFPISKWIYKNLYEKKIQKTEQFLKEIEKFEKEL